MTTTKREAAGRRARAARRTTAEDTRQATADEVRQQRMADAMNSGNYMLGGIFSSASQITSATMIRSQLERIADAMELNVLGELSSTKQVSKARDFLVGKILARVEREELAAQTAVTTQAATKEPAR